MRLAWLQLTLGVKLPSGMDDDAAYFESYGDLATHELMLSARASRAACASTRNGR